MACKPPPLDSLVHPSIPDSITYPDDNIIWQIEWVSLNWWLLWEHNVKLAPIEISCSSHPPSSWPLPEDFCGPPLRNYLIDLEGVPLNPFSFSLSIIRRFNFRVQEQLKWQFVTISLTLLLR